MTPTDRKEILDLSRKAGQWINTLLASGIAEGVAVPAIQLALIERLLLAGGVDQARRWLQTQDALVASHGEAMLTELQKGGG
jgi:hypothetical protein